MVGPITRIILRYGSGALIAWGMTSPGLAEGIVNDPDVVAVAEIVVGLIIGVGTEVYYWAARRYGMAT